MDQTERTDILDRLERQKELYVRALRNTTSELEAKIEELGVLRQLGRLFESSTRLEEVTTFALSLLLETSGAQNASVMLLSNDTGELHLAAAAGADRGPPRYYGPEGHPECMFRTGEGLAGTCARDGVSLVAGDTSLEPRFLTDRGQVAVGSVVCLPLAVHDRILGVVNLSHSTPGGLEHSRLPALGILASYLAIAVSHALLFRELRDINRRLEERVRNRTRRLEETNRELTAAKGEIARQNSQLQERVADRTRELKTALEELRVQHAQLEEANRVKDEFLNNINHELKTPLNAVIGYAGLLRKELADRELPQNPLADLALIEANGKHLQLILENIFSLKDIENGNVELDLSPTDLNELVASTVASVRPRAQEKGLEVSLEALDVPPVLLDPTLIRRVLFNLLDNAVKFSPDGTVTVRTRLADLDPGRPQAKPAPGRETRPYAVVEVEDQGRGIKEEDLDRIFVKFHQAEPPTRKSEGGSGLGLAISKNLVELHGGRIWVNSRPQEGSTFVLGLPLDR